MSIAPLPDTVMHTERCALEPLLATHAEHQRKGYAREAGSRIVEHLFADYDLERVSLLVDTRNVPSIALATALGFTMIETIANADSFKGSTSDEYRFEIRADEFHIPV